MNDIFNGVTSLQELTKMKGGNEKMGKNENPEEIGIGTKEVKRLTEQMVKIVRASVEPVGNKGAQKVVCEVKHPDREEGEDNIRISAAKAERGKGKLETSGLWFNLDEDEKIRKGSLLANFLTFMKVGSIKGLEGKSCMTIEDESGYLVFKAY